MNLIYFLLTHDCNLRCRYCFQEKRPAPGSVTKPTHEVIDAFVEYCSKNHIDDVQLFGGEPLLCRDTFRYTVSTLRKRIPGIRIGMVTNGTLMDKRTLAFVKKNDLYLLLSLDGDRETHNRMRGGFDRILRWAPSFGDKSRLSVALQAGKIPGLYRNIRYIWDQDFASGVYVNVINNYGWYTQQDVAAFEAEYEEAILGMLRGEGILTCALNTWEIIDRSYRKSNICGICALGLAADWEGTLYPCQRAVELGKEFSIGTIWSGIDPEKNLNLRTAIYDSVNNAPCADTYDVASFCPVSIYQKHHSFGGPWGDEFCRMIDLKAKLVAKYYYEIRDQYQLHSSAIPSGIRQDNDPGGKMVQVVSHGSE